MIAWLLVAFVSMVAHGVRAQPALSPQVQQLIVKFRDTTAKRALPADARVAILSSDSKIALVHVRAMALDAQVVALDHPVALSEANAIARQLAANPEVEYAEPDRRVKVQLVPNDELVGAQTYLNNERAGISAFDAWDTANRKRQHRCRSHRYRVPTTRRPGGAVPSRLRLISDPFRANDGDGRDAMHPIPATG